MPNGATEPSAYYLAYDDRYRRVYAQGVQFWTAHPEEIRETTEAVDAFLESIPLTDPLVLECGCGEGHLAAHLTQRNLRYIGVDVSAAAIQKAHVRMTQVRPRVAPTFHLADSTRLHRVQDASVDIAVDNYHFHMLVTDADRQRYLREIYRVLRSGGWAYFRENLSAVGAATESVPSYEEFLKSTAPDFTAEEERNAWQDGKVVRIRLPRVPARFNSREGYVSELEGVGFRVDLIKVVGSACVMHARKPGSGFETK